MELTEIREKLRVGGDLFTYALQATNDLRTAGGYGGVATEVKRLTVGEEGEKILQILRQSAFDEYEEGLINVLSAICVKRKDGTLFSEPSLYDVWKERRDSRRGARSVNDLRLPLGSVIVCLNDSNGQNYGVGVPVMVTEEESSGEGLYLGVGRGGFEGNFLPTERTSIRPAEEREIRDFLRSFPDWRE
jgi:hypothetical protein